MVLQGWRHIVTAPEQALPVPDFAEDGGEEPELVGVYLIGPSGQLFRLGFVIDNEFSDHITEKFNCLWLAHSKLRACSFGPELLIGNLADHIEGESHIIRDGKVLWRKPFLTGEANMSHSIANLEQDHCQLGTGPFQVRPVRPCWRSSPALYGHRHTQFCR